MLISRYLAKEVFVTLISLTSILLLIFMSNQFMRYLTRAASGQIPAMFIMKLMMLEIPNLIGLLLPLGFYVALLIAYGRLYAENEMTVLVACGYGPGKLLKDSLKMALLIAVTVLIIMLWASPKIAVERAKLLRTSGVKTLIQTIIPGSFREISSARQVYYVESMNTSHTMANNIFLARRKDNKWEVFWADKAYLESEEQNKEDFVVFEQGKAYKGIPGKADFEAAEFAKYQTRLPKPNILLKEDIRTAKTSTLLPFNNSDKRKAAELQWRFSIPLMVLALTLVAIPLSRVNSRTGKFAKLLPAIVIYIIYANAMFIMRDWLMAGKIPAWMGLWWLHIVVAGLGMFLIWRNHFRASCA